MRVVVAPDSFKGTLSAPEAAAALARGWRRGDPSADVREIPVADGGDGTLDVLLAALGGERQRARVTGPLGDPVGAAYGLVPTQGGMLAVVEMARASGLALVHPNRRDARLATTYGTGELIRAACARRPVRLLVCLGGSATNDAGAGMAQALGIRLLDERGRDLERGGAALRRLATIDVRGLDRSVRDTEIVVASDVSSPLLGPSGASRQFGPQKGADPATISDLEGSLGHFAAVVHRDLGIDVRSVPGGGAAGGLGAGLVAFLGARIRSGFHVVAEALGLPAMLERSDAAVTGEGRWDAGSTEGKAAAGVLRMAREAGCRTALVVGDLAADADAAADLLYSLVDRVGEAAEAHAADLLVEIGEEIARRLGGD